jgi:UDP-glucose 4-epimerase
LVKAALDGGFLRKQNGEMNMGAVLVTGGAGFIGSHVVDALVGHNYKVIVVDNLLTGRRENINSGAAFYCMDIRSAELANIFSENKVDWVIHHAAQIDVRKSVDDPQFDAQVNICGMLNLMENCRRNGVKGVVFASSGGAIYGEPALLPVIETTPKAPLSPYGVSKLTTENYLYYYYRTYHLPYIALRYANVYGPRQDTGGEAGVIAIFIGKMASGKSASIFGDGQQLRDYVFVKDIARANIQALKKLESGAGSPVSTSIDERAFHIATGTGTPVNELFAKLKKITGFKGEANYEAERKGELRRIFLDIQKAENELSWKPTVKLNDGLKQTADYWANLKK